MTEWLTILKEDSLPRKRRAAVLALGQIASEHREPKGPIDRILPALAKALRSDADPGVRTQAAVVLGQQVSRLRPAVPVGPVRGDPRRAGRRRPAGDGRGPRPVRAALPAGGGPARRRAEGPAAPTRAAAAEGARADRGGRPPGRPRADPDVEGPDPAARRAAAFALGRVDPEDPEPVSTALIWHWRRSRGRVAGSPRGQSCRLVRRVGRAAGRRHGDGTDRIARPARGPDRGGGPGRRRAAGRPGRGRPPTGGPVAREIRPSRPSGS